MIPRSFLAVLDENAGTRMDGTVAGHKTEKATREVTANYFNVLHNEVGMKLQEPKNWGERHVRPVVRYWHFEKKLAAKTLATYLSRLRCLAEWVGKKGMVKDAAYYLPEVDPALLQVHAVATKSKSWAENGVEVIPKLAEAAALDWRLGLMLPMELAFGLRRKEVLLCRPWAADEGTFLRVFDDEAKNGRPRVIRIETAVQREVLDRAKAMVRKREALGWPTKKDGTAANLEYCEGRYHKLMGRLGLTLRDCGVTGHGLRSQFAENTALLHGVLSPTLGGKKGHTPDRDAFNQTRHALSQDLGHNRIDIFRAYGGAFGRGKGHLPPGHLSIVINEAILALCQSSPGGLPLPPADRISDCKTLVEETLKHGAALPLTVAHELWSLHSRRFGTDWLPLELANSQSIEAAALAATRAVGRAGNSLQEARTV